MTQRDNRGKFVRGHAGMGGRPPKKIEEQYVTALDDMIGANEFRKVVAKVLKQSLAGCVGSQNLLFKYVLPDVEKARDAVESQGEATCRIAGSADREAFKREMIARMLMLAKEMASANGKAAKTSRKKKKHDADGSVD